MTDALHHVLRRPQRSRPTVTHRYVDFNAGAGGDGSAASPWDNLNDVTAPSTRDLIVHVTPLAEGATKELTTGTRFAPNSAFDGKRVRFQSATGGAIKINGVYPVIGSGMDGGAVELRDFAFDSAQQWLCYINSTTASFPVTIRNSTVSITFPGLGLVRQDEAAPAEPQDFEFNGVTLTGSTALLQTSAIGELRIEGCDLPFTAAREWITGLSAFAAEIAAIILDDVTITQTGTGANGLLVTVKAGAPAFAGLRNVAVTGEGAGDVNTRVLWIPDGVAAGTSRVHLEDVTISMPTTSQPVVQLGRYDTGQTRAALLATMNGFGSVYLCRVNVTQTSTGRGVDIGVGCDGAEVYDCTWIGRLDASQHTHFINADGVTFTGNRLKGHSILCGIFGADGVFERNVFHALRGTALLMGAYGGSSYDVDANIGNTIKFNIVATGGEDGVDDNPIAFSDYAYNVGEPADNTNVIDYNCYHAPNGGILAKIGADGTECENLAEIKAAWAAQYAGQIAADNDAHSAVGGRLIVYAGSRACPHGVGYVHSFDGGSVTFTIENISDTAVEITGVTAPSGFTVTADPTGEVAAGATATLTVRLDAAGSSGNLTVASDDALLTGYVFGVRG